MVTVAPYGSWESPIAAASLVVSGHPIGGARFVGANIWWLEARPTEGGRLAVRRHADNDEVVDVLPAPWNARTRVHEYGGGAWAAADEGTLVFAEFSDQRLYRLEPGSQKPTPLTPAESGMRFADLIIVAGNTLAIRETHEDGDLRRDVVMVPLDGSAATDARAIRSIVSGSRFLAYPRISPDGSHLAWIAWDHPQMPWDGTELRVGRLDDGVVHEFDTIMGGPTESVLQPEWESDESLYAISDRSGWWNLHRVGVDGTVTALNPVNADVGGPLWGVGARWYSVLDDGRILHTRTCGTDTLAIVDPASGQTEVLDLPLDSITLNDVRGNRVLLNGGSTRLASGVRELQLPSGALVDVRLDVDELPPADYLPDAEAMTFTGAREVHAFVYRPRNPDYEPLPGELPPFIAVVHGGPTAHSTLGMSLNYAYFTSRGVGIIDVNYGGSTGYGREYRQRLTGQWGIVDVEDTIAAIRGLADVGIADGARLAIRGGSAGGWTVLAALVSSDAFACGVSYYGVADLLALAEDTHDFEARYLDGLIGPLPEAKQIYHDRAPVNRVDDLSCPVLLLQGLDDPVVPPAQSEAFRDALVRKGIRHAYLPYEGESHGFRKAETIIHSIQSELSFYGQVMGFETPGTPSLKLWSP
ncbi:MAG: S9 family peptidase [Microbacteriaceae bacterium]|nr:S9 family peptidase [Microbacteriaceae bacterium]